MVWRSFITFWIPSDGVTRFLRLHLEVLRYRRSRAHLAAIEATYRARALDAQIDWVEKVLEEG